MVQILQPQSRQRPSFLQSVMGGLAEGASQAIPDYFQKQSQMKQMQQENAAAKQMGIDLSGIQDPKMRQAIITEGLRQQGKQQIQGQKQGFLEQVFGGGQRQQGQMNQFSDQEFQEPQQMQQQGFDPSKISDADIAMATSMDPNLGRSLMHMKDVALRESRGEREFSQKGIHHGYEVNKDYINKMTDAAQAADEMDMRLDQMLSLKDLPTPLMATTLETLGLPSSLFSADAETADKLSIDLTKNIQQFYGNRILQSEFQAFLRSIPSLKNTTTGRQRIVRNMKAFNDLKRLEYNKMREKEIEYEEKNKPLPASFRRQVLAEMKPEAEKIAKDFKESAKYAKPLKRKKVVSGTSISDDLIDKYILDAKGNVDKARKNALEDGYVID